MNQILLQETEKVLNNAIASVEIEGYKLSDDEKRTLYGSFKRKTHKR